MLVDYSGRRDGAFALVVLQLYLAFLNIRGLLIAALALVSQKVNVSKDSVPNPSCRKAARALKVGTCGFGLAKEAYARVFSCVEIQHTFYQPPQIKTLERWRKELSANFEFTLKAWQLITHDFKSPTYRRLNERYPRLRSKRPATSVRQQ